MNVNVPDSVSLDVCILLLGGTALVCFFAGCFARSLFARRARADIERALSSPLHRIQTADTFIGAALDDDDSADYSESFDAASIRRTNAALVEEGRVMAAQRTNTSLAESLRDPAFARAIHSAILEQTERSVPKSIGDVIRQHLNTGSPPHFSKKPKGV